MDDIKVGSRRQLTRKPPVQNWLQAPSWMYGFAAGILFHPEGINAQAMLPTPDVKPLTCYYCGRLCQMSSYYQSDPDDPVHNLKGWQCNRHPYPIQYLAIPNATYYAFSFSTLYRDKQWSVEVYKLPQGEQWELRQGSRLILQFNFIPPGITPESIDARLPTLLTFS